jgi:hypothetical protein
MKEKKCSSGTSLKIEEELKYDLFIEHPREKRYLL